MQVQAQLWKPERGNVLVVEDDDFFGMLLSHTLAEAGFTATLRGCGQSALDVIEKGMQPDCIVTDLHMPNINGFELLDRLRQHDVLRHCPIIVLSGQDEQADIEKSFRLGATSFLTKPVHPTLLVHQVQLVMRAIRMP